MKRLYRYSFGVTVYDEAQARLTSNGAPVRFAPQQRKLLSFLLARATQAVPKDELFDAVWGYNTGHLGDSALTAAVERLRKALGADGASIETVHGTGYRFAVLPLREDVGGDTDVTWLLAEGQPAPRRPGVLLTALLGRSHDVEVWRAVPVQGGAARIYKLCTERPRLRQLKREARLAGLVERALGPRPDIVRLVATSFEERPYFLEFEDGGENLLAWSQHPGRLAAMALDDRLALFLQIADAVAALHGVPVFHADIKPQNILIAPDPARGPGGWQIRLADFGSGQVQRAELAQALQATAASLSALGGADDELTRGTFMYLAPELWRQQQPATVASDVYALGIVLYQLVVNDLTRRPDEGWERDVNDALLRADIQCAIDGDPARRFASVELLGSALRRRAERLRDAAAHAAERAQGLALRHELERNRARRPLVVAFMALLTGALVITATLLAKADRAEHALARELGTVHRLNQFMIDDFIALADPTLTGRPDVTVREAVEKASAKIDADLAGLSAAERAVLRATLQRSLRGLGEHERAIAEGMKALQAYAALPATERPQEVAVRLNLADSLGRQARFAEARAQTDAAARALAARGPATAVEDEVSLWTTRGMLAALQADMQGAIADWRHAQALIGVPPQVSADLEEHVAFDLADAERMVNQSAAASQGLQALMALQTRRYGAQDARTCYTEAVLASARDDLGEHARAMPMLADAQGCLVHTLGPDHVKTLVASEALGNAYFAAHDYEHAAGVYQDTAERMQPATGPRSVRVLMLETNLAEALLEAGHTARAEAAFASTLGIASTALPADHPMLQELRFGLARCRLDLQRPEGVPALLAGLSVEVLNRIDLRPDWPARLARERDRLARQQGRGGAATGVVRSLPGAAASSGDRPPAR